MMYLLFVMMITIRVETLKMVRIDNLLKKTQRKKDTLGKIAAAAENIHPHLQVPPMTSNNRTTTEML